MTLWNQHPDLTFVATGFFLQESDEDMTRFHFGPVIAAMIGLLTAIPTMADTGMQTGKVLEALPEFRLSVRAADTHPVIRLTPHKPWLIRLDGDAKDIVVDENSAGLSAVRYGRKSIALLSKGTGAAHITVKDAAGGILMSRGVLIPRTGQKYVRLAGSCSDGKPCATPRIFYCPNLCFETSLAQDSLK
jgi:hypothetical protein